MWLVISVNDGRVSQVVEKKTKKKALDNAITQAVEQGATEREDTIRKELEDNGDYIPSKHPEWSICVYEAREQE